MPQDQQLVSAEAARSAVVVEAGQQRIDSETEVDRAERKLPRDGSVPSRKPANLPVESRGPTPSTSANPGSALRPPKKRDYSAYPPEIADMLDTKNPRPLQTRYEADEREDSWAAYMEGQLAAYFAQKPELAQFNISRIDCRTSICEIQAIGYGTDARAAWTVATADIIQQPWHDFKQMSMSTRDPQPGIFAVVLVLANKAE